MSSISSKLFVGTVAVLTSFSPRDVLLHLLYTAMIKPVLAPSKAQMRLLARLNNTGDLYETPGCHLQEPQAEAPWKGPEDG